jgi:hypothetical protein
MPKALGFFVTFCGPRYRPSGNTHGLAAFSPPAAAQYGGLLHLLSITAVSIINCVYDSKIQNLHIQYLWFAHLSCALRNPERHTSKSGIAQFCEMI